MLFRMVLPLSMEILPYDNNPFCRCSKSHVQFPVSSKVPQVPVGKIKRNKIKWFHAYYYLYSQSARIPIVDWCNLIAMSKSVGCECQTPSFVYLVFRLTDMLEFTALECFGFFRKWTTIYKWAKWLNAFGFRFIEWMYTFIMFKTLCGTQYSDIHLIAGVP